MSSINKTLTQMDKIKIIDTIIENYPVLKKERVNIINLIFQKVDNKDKYIFDRITINNKHYYRDKDNILVDSDLKIWGMIHILPDSTQKVVIRHRTERGLYYSKFLAEQDIKMNNTLKEMKSLENNKRKEEKINLIKKPKVLLKENKNNLKK